MRSRSGAWKPCRAASGLSAHDHPLSMTIRFHRADLPAEYAPGDAIAVETETLGLNPHRDRLCVVQISRGDGAADVVAIPRDAPRPERPLAILANSRVLKIFHFARFDLAV